MFYKKACYNRLFGKENKGRVRVETFHEQCQFTLFNCIILRILMTSVSYYSYFISKVNGITKKS